MLYAILSDIHGNVHALEAVIEACRAQGADRFVVLGDIVGYGPYPNECCEAVRALDAVVVRGNHDEAAVTAGKELWFTSAAARCILWTRDVLTEGNTLFLASLLPIALVDGFTACHGSVPDPDCYTDSPLTAMLSFRDMQTDLAFFGHTHVAEWFEYDPRTDRLPAERLCCEGCEIALEDGAMYMVNPGAVGQPRDGVSTACYGLYDAAQARVIVERAAYNVTAAQRAILDAGLPEFMAARLSVGV
jgi:predicted phosphodiesterase